MFPPSHHRRTSVALLAVSCCPSSAASFVSSGWRSLLSSRQEDQIKRCTEDGWAPSEWRIGGQPMIFPAFPLFSFHLFPVRCQTDDVRGKYYWFGLMVYSVLSSSQLQSQFWWQNREMRLKKTRSAVNLPPVAHRVEPLQPLCNSSAIDTQWCLLLGAKQRNEELSSVLTDIVTNGPQLAVGV